MRHENNLTSNDEDTKTQSFEISPPLHYVLGSGCVKQNMNEFSDGELTGKNLVFIVGCPRSGTTWLQRLLAAHPQIKTGQESQLFDYIGPQLQRWKRDMVAAGGGRGGVGLPCYFNEPEFLDILKRHLGSLLAPMLEQLKPVQFFLDKTPGHALFVPEITALLPQAKIIHLARDPRDTTASLLAASRGWGSKWAPDSARKAVRMWWQHVSSVRKASKNLSPHQFLEIHYEDLHRDPVSTLRSIMQLLGLEWTDDAIKLAVSANAAEELRQDRGTPIPLGGEHGKLNHRVVREPQDFIRRARPGAWREDLNWLERLQIQFMLWKIAPEWKKYARS